MVSIGCRAWSMNALPVQRRSSQLSAFSPVPDPTTNLTPQRRRQPKVPFTIHITKDFDQMSQVAAQLVEASIAHRLAEADSFVLGLATGSSPTGVYKHLAEAFKLEAQVGCTRVTTFNLDEYVRLPGENPQQRLHPESYSFFMVSGAVRAAAPTPDSADERAVGTLVDARTRCSRPCQQGIPVRGGRQGSRGRHRPGRRGLPRVD